VDWIKYPYRCKAQLNADDPTLTTIQWTVARPGAPLLSLPSRVCNLALESDKEWYVEPVGERWEGGRRAFWTTTPPGIDGQHRCGTDADFMFGGTYTPLPVVRYGALGWPLCCDPPPKVVGGAGAGGRGDVTVITTDVVIGGLGVDGASSDAAELVDATAGGLGVGGASSDELVFTDATAGGLLVGGATSDTYSGIYLFDACVDVNGTNATAHKMDIGPGQVANVVGWVTDNGSWWIQSNTLQENGNTVGPDLWSSCRANAGAGDVTISATVVVAASIFCEGAICGRASSHSLGYFLRFNTATNALTLELVVGSSSTQLAIQSLGWAASSTHTLALKMGGSTLTCSADGVMVFTVSNSAIGNGVHTHGLAAHVNVGAFDPPQFSAFEVTP
jgi:hypothetical protein